MAKILSTKIQEDGLTLLVSCLAEKTEYQPFKTRITQQILKGVEVPGFRKGKAPESLAIKHVDIVQFQQTLYTESIDKFYTELNPEIQKFLEENKRVAAGNPNIEPDSIKEDNDDFAFTLTIRLLPEIDLGQLSKLKITEPSADEISNRLSFEEFKAREEKNLLKVFNDYDEVVDGVVVKDSQVLADLDEHDQTLDQKKQDKNVLVQLGFKNFPEGFEKALIGVKAGETKEFETDVPTDHGHDHHFAFKVTVHKVLKAKYTTPEEILENSKEAIQRFKDKQGFLDFLNKIYDQETRDILTSIRRRAVINAIVENVKIEQMPNEAIEAETKRIVESLTSQAEQQKKTLADLFTASGLPGSEGEKLKDKDVPDLVKKYVSSEFKLVEILRAAYYINVKDKATEQNIDDLAKLMKQNPQYYGIGVEEAKDQEKLRDVANDRLVREKAFAWILDQITFEKTQVSEKKETKKAKK
jgi:trigger factor